MNVQFIPMRIRPFLLFRSSHANPKQIRIRPVDSLDDAMVIFIRKFRLIRRRISNHLDVRIYFSCLLADQFQHLFRATHKHNPLLVFVLVFVMVFVLVFVQPSHFKLKQVPSCYTFLGQALRLYPSAGLHYAHPVRNKHITVCQRLSKERVLACRIIRMGIYRVDKQLALWQQGKLRLAA